ncbi:MAG: hypothetical protein EBT07_12270 [Actinobacteria bacterium]|nr:hypothetical protein [Actinomycetota bacterium]
MDTYIPSGEESAQEQQFLQGLVGQIQSRDAVAIPKYATQLFTNFCGNYQTLAVNATMSDAVSSSFFSAKMDKYFGFYITNEGAVYGNRSDWTYPPSSPLVGQGIAQIAGCPAGTPPAGYDQSPAWVPSPTYVGSVLSWNWDANPTTYIAQPKPPPTMYDPTADPIYPQLAFYRQSFSTAPFYVWMPKWMKSFSIGMKLYNSAGASQNILIASKTNAKWKTPTINSSVAPDGSYSIEALSQAQLKSELGKRFNYYLTATRITGSAFGVQETTFAGLWYVDSFEHTSLNVITANVVNDFPNSVLGISNNLPQTFFRQVWTDDPTAVTYLLRDPDNNIGAPVDICVATPSNPNRSTQGAVNQKITFNLASPPSLPYRFYFRYWLRMGTGTRFVVSYTYAVDYPVGYPSVPATFSMAPASYDVIHSRQDFQHRLWV